MHFSQYRYRIFLALVVLAAALAACQPAPTRTPPAAQPQSAPMNEAPAAATAAQQSPGAYPAPVVEEATPVVGYPVETPQAEVIGAVGYPVEPQEGIPLKSYPAPQKDASPTGSVPVVENRAKITGTISNILPDTNDPKNKRLSIQLLTTEDIDSLPNFTRELVGGQVLFNIEGSLLEGLGKGDRFEAVVQMVGDEYDQRFVVTEIKKLQ
jgi:hypothetical protein